MKKKLLTLAAVSCIFLLSGVFLFSGCGLEPPPMVLNTDEQFAEPVPDVVSITGTDESGIGQESIRTLPEKPQNVGAPDVGQESGVPEYKYTPREWKPELTYGAAERTAPSVGGGMYPRVPIIKPAPFQVAQDQGCCTHQGKSVACPQGLPTGSRSVQFVQGGTQWTTPSGSNVFVPQTTFPPCPTTPATSTQAPTTPSEPLSVTPQERGRQEERRAGGLLKEGEGPAGLPYPIEIHGTDVETQIKGLGELIGQQQQPSVAQETPGQPPPEHKAPEELFTAFVALDRHLTDLIDRAKDGKLSGQDLADAIHGIEMERFYLIRGVFAGDKLFGVPASDVIIYFDLVDEFLSLASFSKGIFSSPARAASYLESAKRAKQELERRFHGAAGR